MATKLGKEGKERVRHPSASIADAAALPSKTRLVVNVSVMVGFAPGKTPPFKQSVVKTQSWVSLGAGGCGTARKSSTLAMSRPRRQ